MEASQPAPEPETVQAGLVHLPPCVVETDAVNTAETAQLPTPQVETLPMFVLPEIEEDGVQDSSGNAYSL